MANSTGPLRIGGNAIWPEWFNGLIDDARVYNRALTASEIQGDMNTPVSPPAPPDTAPPTAPAGLTATGSLAAVSLSWTAASDNVGVVKYDVHRSTTAGFTPSAANRVAQPTGTSYQDTGLAAGTYYYRVIAEDAAGNVGPASNEASATATADTTSPTVSVTAPAAGATVSGTVNVTANASDDVGVAGVQFTLDGVSLGTEDLASPYSVSWNTAAVANGSHTLRAVARDAAGNTTTSAPVAVTVSNAAGPSGLVAAYGFNAGSGTTTADSSGNALVGTLNGPTWTTAGKYGAALSFDGVNDWVTVSDAAALDLTTKMTLEAWVNPSQLTGKWRTVILKEQPAELVYALYAASDTNVPMGIVFTGGAERKAKGTTALALNTWTHLALTYDGTTLRLYVNGTQTASLATTGTMPNSSGALRIGGNGVWSEWFAGKIDEVRVYNKALTAAEIQADMNRPV
jgi:hypothetical protein